MEKSETMKRYEAETGKTPSPYQTDGRPPMKIKVGDSMMTKEQIEEEIGYLTHIIYLEGLSPDEAEEIEHQLDILLNQLDRIEKASGLV